LHEALDERTPLLERVKFLAIFTSNLDEFFMKRMALIRPSPQDALHSADERRDHQLQIRRMVSGMLAEQAACFTGVIRPRLAEHGIDLRDWAALTECQHAALSARFDTEISPVLTPLGLDAAHPFPFVSNLSTSWAFRLTDPVTGESVVVRVKVPRELPQWLRVRVDEEP